MIRHNFKVEVHELGATITGGDSAPGPNSCGHFCLTFGSVCCLCMNGKWPLCKICQLGTD